MSTDLLNGETEIPQYADRTRLAALKVAGGEALARREFVGGAEHGLRWIAATVGDQLVGRGRREPVLREELIRPQPVVLLHRVHDVVAADFVPVGRVRHRSPPIFSRKPLREARASTRTGRPGSLGWGSRVDRVAEELRDGGRDLTRVRRQCEVAGVEESDVRRWNVALECLGAWRQEERIVPAPY